MRLRFVKRKVQPFDAGFPQYQFILQYGINHPIPGVGGYELKWFDVPVEDEGSSRD